MFLFQYNFIWTGCKLRFQKDECLLPEENVEITISNFRLPVSENLTRNDRSRKPRRVSDSFNESAQVSLTDKRELSHR